MTEALEKAFQQAQRLPESQQQEIAELIEQKLADLRWDELYAKPESETLLCRLAAEAIEEDDAGRTQTRTTTGPAGVGACQGQSSPSGLTAQASK